MTPQDVITTARYIISDEAGAAVGARQSDPELLGYFNDGLKEAALINPMLFSATIDYVCAAGVHQEVSTTNAVRLLDVLGIKGGAAITQFDRSAMDSFYPGWRTDTAGTVQQWAQLLGDPLVFFIYPPAPASPVQTLDIRVVQNPAVYALTDIVTDIAPAYAPAMVDYVVFRAESKDDENVLNQRAAAHYTAFAAIIGAK